MLEIGREIIHQLTITAIEYALASFLEEFVDPQTAREIANGIVTAFDLALSARNKAIDDKLGVANSNNDYETYYRTMSQEDYDYLQLTGEVRSTGETFISSTKGYSQKYDGVLVEFTTNAGTKSALEKIGVKNKSTLTNKMYPDMPFVNSVENWTINNAQFKGEGLQINIGLGKGAGLETFNLNIIGYRKV